MSFTKKVEDFVCEHCGTHVQGTGFTNHCPKCLWSKHVDRDPGDRAEDCGGMMEPVALEGSTPNYYVIHKCTKCSIERRIRVAVDDDTDTLILMARRQKMP